MAKKTVRSDAPAAPSSPSRRRAPAAGRGTSTRRESPAVESTHAASATLDQPPPIDSAADMRLSGDAGSASERTPTYEEIAQAAYRRYLERGGQDGQDFDDWLEAERSLRSRSS
jgi:hypothetical protein